MCLLIKILNDVAQAGIEVSAKINQYFAGNLNIFKVIAGTVSYKQNSFQSLSALSSIQCQAHSTTVYTKEPHETFVHMLTPKASQIY